MSGAASSPSAVSRGGAVATVFACGLCGCRFTHGGRVCEACPISNGCDLVRCPSCGYQFPRASRIADALARLWKAAAMKWIRA